MRAALFALSFCVLSLCALLPLPLAAQERVTVLALQAYTASQTVGPLHIGTPPPATAPEASPHGIDGPRLHLVGRLLSSGVSDMRPQQTRHTPQHITNLSHLLQW